jgi:hypothetical protein
MARLVTLARGLFILITIVTAIPAIAAAINPPDEPTIAIVWIVLAISCVGVITTWRDN